MPPVHCAFVAHWPHVLMPCLSVPQYGVVPPHCESTAHSSHTPLAVWHVRPPPPQSPSARQTQKPVALQWPVAHWPSFRHSTHVSAGLQYLPVGKSGLVQSASFTQSTQLCDFGSQTLGVNGRKPQSALVSHATHACDVGSQMPPPGWFAQSLAPQHPKGHASHARVFGSQYEAPGLVHSASDAHAHACVCASHVPRSLQSAAVQHAYGHDAHACFCGSQ